MCAINYDVTTQRPPRPEDALACGAHLLPGALGIGRSSPQLGSVLYLLSAYVRLHKVPQQLRFGTPSTPNTAVRGPSGRRTQVIPAWEALGNNLKGQTPVPQ